MARDIIIFDTTLRDGEQAPGNTMTPEEKLRLARQLDALGVDVIETGFPAASEGDYRSVATRSQAVFYEHGFTSNRGASHTDFYCDASMSQPIGVASNSLDLQGGTFRFQDGTELPYGLTPF